MSVSLKASDIVKNLPSLDFELGLSAIVNDSSLLSLRLKSYAHSITICSQSVFIISLLTEALDHAMKQSRAVSINYKIGFIGCGRLGKIIIKCLLHFKIVKPQNIYVSTRRPELLKELSDVGIATCFNNKKVGSICQLLCICCLPSQLPTVAESLQGSLSSITLVYSIVGGVTLQRHCQLLRTNFILRPTFLWPDSGWTVECIENYISQVTTLIQKEDVIKLTCPPSPATGNSECSTITQIVLAILNLLTSIGIGKDMANRICTAEMLRQPDHVAVLLDMLVADELTSADKRTLQLPLLPLNKATHNVNALLGSQEMYRCLVDKYKQTLSPTVEKSQPPHNLVCNTTSYD